MRFIKNVSRKGHLCGESLLNRHTSRLVNNCRCCSLETSFVHVALLHCYTSQNMDDCSVLLENAALRSLPLFSPGELSRFGKLHPKSGRWWHTSSSPKCPAVGANGGLDWELRTGKGREPMYQLARGPKLPPARLQPFVREPS